MDWLKGILSALGGIAKPVADYMSEGRQIKAAAAERKDELKKLAFETKLESVRKAEDANIQLDLTHGSDPILWANDVTLILALLPCVLAFYPPALPHIMAGFAALEKYPEWLKYSLGMMLISVWGYRNLVSPIIQSIAKAYLSSKKL